MTLAPEELEGREEQENRKGHENDENNTRKTGT